MRSKWIPAKNSEDTWILSDSKYDGYSGFISRHADEYMAFFGRQAGTTHMIKERFSTAKGAKKACISAIESLMIGTINPLDL